MTLRAKILLYLVLIHLILGTVAVFALRDNRPWLLAAEALFAVSVAIGFVLVREFFVPLELIRTGADLMRERDFTTHFREVGQPEMDLLIGIYNRMVDQLREERLKLEEQHQLLDKILRASPAGILTLDFDSRVTLINPAAEQLVHAAAEDAIGRRLSEIGGPAAVDVARVEPGRSAVLPLPGGRRIRCQRVRFMDRGFERSFLLLEELTRELRESEKAAYGKLIRMMSHEVNNSVGAVRSLLESCGTYGSQLRDDDRSDFDRALVVAAERLEHLNAFTNGFADVVRLPPPQPAPCDLAPLLRDVLTLMGPELRRRGVVADLSIETERTEARVDKNQLEQVLVNVIKNACEAMERGGTLTVRLEQEGQRLQLSIRDTGPGIPEEVRARLFTPFFSTKRDGRGIGLTVIQEILGRHGFEYSLADLDSKGAEFRIGF